MIKKSEVDSIVESLNKNKACIVSTDTVPGIISKSKEQIYRIKNRDLNKKLITFVDRKIKTENKIANYIMDKYWPGAVTIILDGISYRMPNDKDLLEIIKLTGNLYSSSANISGHEILKNEEQAREVFKDYKDEIYISSFTRDASKLSSTVIDCDNMKVIRQGDIVVDIKNIQSSKRLIYLGSDHAGFQMKEKVSFYLKKLGHEVIDKGTYSSERANYASYGSIVANEVRNNYGSVGIIICGTGIGISIAANRVKGIRSAPITSAKMATISRKHNDLNVLALAGRKISFWKNKRIVNAFLNTKYEGGRHQERIESLDNVNY
jgi:ribose 5-phosphate isomerase B